MAIASRSRAPIGDLNGMSSTLRFLGDPTRLKIIASMAESEQCVCDLTHDLGLSQPLVSWHLARLREAGLVRTRRQGNWVYYSLDPEKWTTTLSSIRTLLDLAELPPEAALGSRESCDVTEAQGRHP